ncbi:MAG: hypothetical protein LBH43_06080 [Treponema sp.]|nr:hypothetical protein [Treponema sp.]
MNETERDLLDKAALKAFGALLARRNGEFQAFKTVAAEAWGAAQAFVDARKENAMSRYMNILSKHEGLEALRRILELGGTTGRGLDHMVGRYADRPDPLRAFAEENIGPRTSGQIAVTRFLANKKMNKGA